MVTNAKIGTALVGGYLLGRTKKARLALGLGMFLVGRKLRLDPDALRRTLSDTPLLGELNGQVREQIVEATRTAAKGALTKRVGGLADSLHERTLGLRGDVDRDGDRDDAEADGRAGSSEAAAEEEREDAPARRSTRRPASGAGTSRRSTAPARRDASRDGRSTTRTAGKAAAGGAGKATRKATSTARRTAKATTAGRSGRGGGEDA
jgi:hypothetical protein